MIDKNGKELYLLDQVRIFTRYKGIIIGFTDDINGIRAIIHTSTGLSSCYSEEISKRITVYSAKDALEEKIPVLSRLFKCWFTSSPNGCPESWCDYANNIDIFINDLLKKESKYIYKFTEIYEIIESGISYREVHIDIRKFNKILKSISVCKS